MRQHVVAEYIGSKHLSQTWLWKHVDGAIAAQLRLREGADIADIEFGVCGGLDETSQQVRYCLEVVQVAPASDPGIPDDSVEFLSSGQQLLRKCLDCEESRQVDEYAL